MNEPQSTFRYTIGPDEVCMTVWGETVRGGPQVLLDEDDDLTAGTAWSDDGYTIVPLLSGLQAAALRTEITALVVELLEEAGTDPGPDFELEHYHEAVDDATHEIVVRRSQLGFGIERLPIRADSIVAAASRACNKGLSVRWPSVGQAENPSDPEERFCIRIARPNLPDNNPPHRDVWLDRLRNAVNLYLPVCGSGTRSALGLVPGSHRWREADLERTRSGAKIDGRSYSVPSVTTAPGGVRLIRPNPSTRELLVFSPYLVHGGARNFDNGTRVSLEMRLWRAPPETAADDWRRSAHL